MVLTAQMLQSFQREERTSTCIRPGAVTGSVEKTPSRGGEHPFRSPNTEPHMQPWFSRRRPLQTRPLPRSTHLPPASLEGQVQRQRACPSRQTGALKGWARASWHPGWRTPLSLWPVSLLQSDQQSGRSNACLGVAEGQEGQDLRGPCVRACSVPREDRSPGK